MKKIISSTVLALGVFLLPVAQVFAGPLDFPGQEGTITSVFNWATNILNAAIGLIIGAAAVVFLYGIFQSIRNGDKEEERTKGRQFMIYGIIGLAVMLSFWGLVSFVQRSFGFNTTNNAPQFNRVSGSSGGSSSFGADSQDNSGYTVDNSSAVDSYESQMNGTAAQ